MDIGNNLLNEWCWFMDLAEFIYRFSKEYSVQHLDDAEEGVFVDEIVEDVYLIRRY